MIEAFWIDQLVGVGNNYFLYPVGGSSGPELKYMGANFTAGQFGGWAPIGVEVTASGYEVAWKMAGVDQYTAWNTDSSGNYISNIIGAVSGASSALESLETSFHQDLNGDGTIGVGCRRRSMIESFGSTSLTGIANHFYLYNSAGSGPSLKYLGADYVVGSPWTPIGAEQTASGYEVAWKYGSADTYTVWNTDSNGNFVSDTIGAVSGASSVLQSLEPSFQQDLNGDGHIGLGTVIESFGSTSLTAIANHFYLYNSAGSGPSLKYLGADYVVGSPWTPIGAEQTASGYEVAWKYGSADTYTVWNTDSNGNFVSDTIGAVSGTSSVLQSLEPSFQQDLNGDGHIGLGMAVISGNADAFVFNLPAMVCMTALQDCRQAFWSVALFSAVVNMLMLAGPLYMLQIYDRVLSSRSVPTLVALSIFLVGAYVFQGALDIIRSRIVVRAAALLDRRLGTTVHGAVLHLAIQSRHAGEAQQPVRNLDQIRAFLTSPGPIAIVDLPWMPVFLVICFLVHPWLGLVALAGAILLIIVTVLNERASRAPARAVAKEAGMRATMIEADRRNSETAIAMGMGGTLAKRWARINDRLSEGARAFERCRRRSYGSISQGSAASAAIGDSWARRLSGYPAGADGRRDDRRFDHDGPRAGADRNRDRQLAHVHRRPAEHQLAFRRVGAGCRTDARDRRCCPNPCQSLEVEMLTVAAPGSKVAIVKDAQFRLAAGDVLGIIGPNGAGKTSLIRTLVGIWPPARGEVRFDGAPFDQWDPEFIGRHIGYVPQVAELFEGTIAENISRMEVKPDSEAVLRAARAAGVHDMVLRLAGGYDTRIGEGGAVLSAGQRQRIAIARAVYGEPFLIVLDEPNANLDNDGEIALLKTVRDLKARGAIVIIVAHRPSALAACDKVLFLANGAQQAFGPRDEILQKVLARPAAIRRGRRSQGRRDVYGAGATDDSRPRRSESCHS